MKKSLTYADAGVDIDKASDFVDRIKQIAHNTPRSGVIGEIGGFGGLFSLNVSNLNSPVLVSSTDGVGTKLKIAFMTGKHHTVGIDLVAMCVNDIVVEGAKPLFFLDYLSMGTLDPDIATAVVTGVGEGCRQAGCALLGGETAEMPGFYQDKEYDLVGFVVGIVDNSKIIDGTDIRVGDQIIGISSSGLHSNGYSLVRKICFDVLKLDIDAYVPELGQTLAEELLTPTKIYVDNIHPIVRDLPVHGLAHITGGGITDNIIRAVPDGCGILLRKNSWEIPPVFKFLQDAGNITESEMMRTFNNGIGFVAIVPENSAQEVIEWLAAVNEKAFAIGEVVEQEDGKEGVEWV